LLQNFALQGKMEGDKSLGGHAGGSDDRGKKIVQAVESVLHKRRNIEQLKPNVFYSSRWV